VTARSAAVARRRRRAGSAASRERRPVALTGTPGVGKTAVARRLAPSWKAVEVADVALRVGAARRVRGGVEVDLPRLRTALRAPRALEGVDVLVGHLAHLLPVREAIVLRCHPRELARRLDRARRGSASDRAENFVSEALDLVLAEAARAGIPIYEIDTTHRTVGDVARDVRRRLGRDGAPRRGIVDWLADGSVTAHLLDGAG